MGFGIMRRRDREQQVQYDDQQEDEAQDQRTLENTGERMPVPSRLYAGYDDRAIRVAGKVATGMYNNLVRMDDEYGTMTAQAEPMLTHGSLFDNETSSLMDRSDRAVRIMQQRTESMIIQNRRNGEWVIKHRAERQVFMDRLFEYVQAHTRLGERTAVALASVLNNGASLVENHDAILAFDEDEEATRGTYFELQERKLGVGQMLTTLGAQHERASNNLLDAEDAAEERAQRVRLMGVTPTDSEIADSYAELKAKDPKDANAAALDALLGAADLAYSYGNNVDAVATIDAGVMNAQATVNRLTDKIKRFKGKDSKLDRDIENTLAELQKLQDTRNQIEALSGRLLQDVVKEGKSAAKRTLVQTKFHDPNVQKLYEEGELLRQYGDEGREYIRAFLESMDAMNAVDIPVAPRHRDLDLGRDEEKVITLKRMVELAGEEVADEVLSESLTIIARAFGIPQLTERQYLQRQAIEQ
jgi:hypothetical protein